MINDLIRLFRFNWFSNLNVQRHFPQKIGGGRAIANAHLGIFHCAFEMAHSPPSPPPSLLKQTTVFIVSFHLCAIFQNVFWKFDDSARSLVRKIFICEALVSLRVANAALVALSHMCRGCGRRFRPSVAVVDGCRFRPTSGRPESTSMIIIMAQQQSVPLVEECWQPSELSVEERNLLSGANKFSSCWWMLLY